MSILASLDSLKITEPTPEDLSIVSCEYHRNNPTFNTKFTEPQFEIDVNYPDSFILPHESYIQFTGQLLKADGTRYLATDNVALTNNAMMYLFSSIEYSINEKLIERVASPGQATTMLGALKYPNDFAVAQGMLQCWQKDSYPGVNNPGYDHRRTVIMTADDAANVGKFSFIVPLKHIFGFCDTYEKVIFGAKHKILFVRASDNDAIFRGGASGALTAATAGKIELTDVSWFMPKVLPSDVENLMLLSEVREKTTIDMRFSSITCERADTVPAGLLSFTWDMGIKGAPEVPRYVILAFQTDKKLNQERNPAVFDHCDVTNISVEYNNDKYPYEPFNIDFSANNFARLYKEASKFSIKHYGMDELVSHSGISYIDFKTVFPIYVIDTSRQRESLKGNCPSMRIEVMFKTAVPANTSAFAVLVSDRRMLLSSDGSRYSMIQ